MTGAVTKEERLAMAVVLKMLRRHQIEVIQDALRWLEGNQPPQALAAFVADNTALNNAQVALFHLLQYAPTQPNEPAPPPDPPAGNVVHLKPPR